MKKESRATASNCDLAVRFENSFQRLLAQEKLVAHEKNLSEFFEFIATRLFGNFPSRKNNYFDGVVGLTAKTKSVRQVEFEGEIWVGADQDQWTEPFHATVTDKRITKEGIWIVLQIGADRAQGEVMAICNVINA